MNFRFFVVFILLLFTVTKVFSQFDIDVNVQSGASAQYSNDVEFTSDGGYIVTGSFVDSVSFAPLSVLGTPSIFGNFDMFLVKYGSQGDPIWAVSGGGGGTDGANSVAISPYDDIYVTGNLGDSYVGLQILQNKIKTTKKLKNYFIKKYFEPEIQIKLTRKLLKFANSSIDISDGLIDDLKKMMNKQKLSYKILEEKIPISNNLLNYLKKNNFKKTDFVSNGDDYQILFTASADKSRIISSTSKNLGIKISKIGKIGLNNKKSIIINQKGEHLLIKKQGYKHQF